MKTMVLVKPLSGHLVCIVAVKDLTLPSQQQFLRFVLFTQEVNAVSIV